MTKTEQEAVPESFVAGLKADRFEDYRVIPIAENYDSGWHMADWHGRFLVLSGRVELDFGDGKFSYGGGESYEVPANIRHREAFGAAGGSLVIARRSAGSPLPSLSASAGAVSLS